MPRASIIIATHNRPDLISRAVQSAGSSAADVEILVVDDASSEQTAQICKALSNIKYLRADRNQGLGGARNIGLVASSGAYISFLDDDDMRLPDTLDRQIELLEREPSAGLIFGQAIVSNHESQSPQGYYPHECPQGDLFWKLLTRNFIPCGSVVFRRSCLSRVGLLDDASRGIEDWDLWVRIAELYPVIALETPVIVWRRSTPASGQLTSQAAQIVSLCVRQFREWMKLPRAMAASRETKRAVWRSFSENMAEHLIWESVRALRHGKLYEPLKNLAVVRRLHPLTILRIGQHRVLRIPQAGIRESSMSFDIQPRSASCRSGQEVVEK
jgi:glycosyltransferase involved in cell wall biosynthesis